jgi:antitoxin VapB
MPLNIKNESAHKMAKELASLTDTSITDAVVKAIEDALGRAKNRKKEFDRILLSDLNEIAIHCASLPVLDNRQPDDIVGYDEQGLPSS